MIGWGDLPTWLAAVGTIGILGSAVWQSGAERRRRLVADEELQAERHVAQATHVVAYIGEEERAEALAEVPADDQGQTSIFLVNNSAEPVYSVVAGIVFVHGAGPHSLEEMIELHQKQFQRRGPSPR